MCFMISLKCFFSEKMLFKKTWACAAKLVKMLPLDKKKSFFFLQKRFVWTICIHKSQVLCMKGRGGTVWQTLANRIIAPRAPHIIQEKAANNKKSEVASKIQKSTWKKLLFLKWKIAQRSDFEIQIQTSWASRKAGPAHRTYFLKAAMAEKKQNVNIYTWSNLSSINSTSLSLSTSWSYSSSSSPSI